jgi:phosphoglycerate dehydrogenase-like enzyme
MTITQGNAQEQTLRGARPLRVHIENARKLHRVFIVTDDHVRAALERHRDVAPYLDISVGWDFDIYERAMASADVLIGYRFPTDNLRGYAPNLSWILVLAAGIDYLLPLTWLPPDVRLARNSGAHVPKAVQSASMAILMLNARIPELLASQRRHEWNRLFTPTVAGTTLAIIGVGHIGGGVAREAKRMNMRVIGVRRSRHGHEAVDQMYGPDDLGVVLPQADFVLVNAALTSATERLIGRKEFDLMKPDAGFINMSRGGLVDYDALAEKLRRGELRGAVVDVTFPEPLPADSPIWDVPNLIITPHVLSDDLDEYIPRTLDVFMDDVRRYFAGEQLKNQVDPSVEY